MFAKTMPSTRYFWYFTKAEQYSDAVRSMMLDCCGSGFLVYATYAHSND
jgi:hypothetical protein